MSILTRRAHRHGLVFWIVMSAACASAARLADYAMPLESVERPASVAARWGAHRIDASPDTSTFEDGLIEAQVVPMNGVFVISIRNKSDHALNVVWDGMSYIGPDGSRSGVVQQEFLGEDVRRRQTPTTVASQAATTVTAVPTAHVRDGAVIRDFVEPALTLPDSEVRLVVPFFVDGVTSEYTFIFRPHDIEVIEYQPSQCDSPCSRVTVPHTYAQAGDSVVVRRGGAILRVRANVQGRQIDRLSPGTRLRIEESVNNTWLRIAWGDGVAFIRRSEVEKVIVP